MTKIRIVNVTMDTLRPNYFYSFHMKVNRCRHLFSIAGQLLILIRKFNEGKNSNFDRRVSVFVLPIRNKSPFSWKIIASFKIGRMSLKLLAIRPKRKIEMQIIYDGRKARVWEFVFQGLNIGKWSPVKHCDEVAVVKMWKPLGESAVKRTTGVKWTTHPISLAGAAIEF